MNVKLRSRTKRSARSRSSFRTRNASKFICATPPKRSSTTWSDNHAFADVIGTVLINPQEHIEYAETIATRELTPNKVFIAEVFFPKYPELRMRQKFLTAP